MDYGENVKFPDDEKKSWEVARAPRESKYRRPHRSYVLLAACQDIEYAHEMNEPDVAGEHSRRQRYGVFTTALLKHLQQYHPTSHSLTYLELMESIRADLLSVQCPTCYGFNKDRWLFRVEARSQLHTEPVFILSNLKGTRWDRVIRDYRFTLIGRDNAPCQLVADQTLSVFKLEKYPEDRTTFADTYKLKVRAVSGHDRWVSQDKLWASQVHLSRGMDLGTQAQSTDIFIVVPALVVRVGSMHRVGKDSRFSFRLNKNSPPTELKVDRIEQHRSILLFKDNTPAPYNISTDIKVSWIADSSSVVRICLKGRGLEHVVETSHFTLVDRDADVVVSLHKDRIG